MTNAYRNVFRVTARRALREEGRFEYVVSRPNHEAVRSDKTFPTHAVAKTAGVEHARALARGITPAPTIE